MARALVLHVGMHKTGTTSVQQTLAAHRAALQAAGLSYMDGEANHSRLVHSAFTDEPHRYHVNRRHGLHRPEDAVAHAAECRDRLGAFLRDAPGPTLLLSGEDVGTLGAAGARRLLAFARPLVDRIVVVGLVRPPRAFVASAVQQRVRGGATLEEIEDGGVAPQYRLRFAPFLDAPEVAEVRLRPYARDALARGCSVATVLEMAGAPPDLYDRLAVARANAGASRLGAVLALAANRAVPVFLPDGAANPARSPRLARLFDRLEGPRFAPPRALVEARLARAAEDVAWMEGVLGRRFAEEAGEADAQDHDGLDAVAGAELEALARGLNAFLREQEEARAAARRGRGAPGAAVPPPAAPSAAPVPAPGREARRAARREQRRKEAGRAWR